MGKTAYLYGDVYLEHDTGWGHPERPERLTAIDNHLRTAPWYPDLVRVEPAYADREHIEKIHSASYIDRIHQEIAQGIPYIDSMDTTVCLNSFRVAMEAVGGCLNMCDTIMQGHADKGFCAVRPPGHHAERNYSAGFCLFNNIAICARYLQDEHGLKKVAIVDWDVHHGNGTQHSFYDDNTVLYISTHQFPHYPGTGSVMENGKDRGKGYTLNIPMRAGSSDRDYLNAFHDLIIPSLENFKPEIILVSAGFDAHRADPLAEIRLSTDAYAEFSAMLVEAAGKYADNRIIAFLEGGYNLDTLAHCVERVMDAFVNS